MDDPIGTVPPAGAAAPGILALALERRERTQHRTNRGLDWTALVLSIVLPPAGLIASVANLVLSSRRIGWVTGLGKAALSLSLVLTVILGGVGVVVGNALRDQAARDAIVRSSAAWCSRLGSQGVLSSPTFGWPTPAASIPASLAAMQSYQRFWSGLAAIAPAQMRAPTEQIASTAAAIISSLQASRVLDDAADVSQMQAVVTSSTIPAWVTEYCK